MRTKTQLAASHSDPQPQRVLKVREFELASERRESFFRLFVNSVTSWFAGLIDCGPGFQRRFPSVPNPQSAGSLPAVAGNPNSGGPLKVSGTVYLFLPALITS